MIQRADELTEQGRLAEALELLRGQVNGTGPDPVESPDTVSAEALRYGRMGTLAWQLGRGEDAWRYTRQAYDLCRELGDGEGCMTYLERLWMLAEEYQLTEDCRTV